MQFDELSPGLAPVAEPTIMLLVGTGLVGLVGFKRKFGKNEQ